MKEVNNEIDNLTAEEKQRYYFELACNPSMSHCAAMVVIAINHAIRTYLKRNVSLNFDNAENTKSLIESMNSFLLKKAPGVWMYYHPRIERTSEEEREYLNLSEKDRKRYDCELQLDPSLSHKQLIFIVAARHMISEYQNSRLIE